MARPVLPVPRARGRSPAPAEGPPAGAALIWAALGTVCAVWGSTYLAIRVAIRTLPPLLMASVRFLLAGGVLYAWSIRRGDRDGDRPGAPEWRAATIVGGALLLGGNGGVVWAEQRIPSGITALLVATVPLWMVLIAGLAFRERVNRLELSGIALGFGGLVVLAGPSGSGRLDLAGVLVLMLAALSWAAGSLYSRRARLPTRPLLATAMEMLAGGALLGVAGIARGELGDVHVSRVSGASVLALAYLIGFGSLVAFSAYVWLLRVARTSVVSTYAYVNPVVAVLLGWAILGEPVTARTLLAGGVIMVAVLLIVTGRAAAVATAEPVGSPADCPAPPDAAGRREADG